jgi:hypothetical protein
VETIYLYSRGIPRIVNVLCDNGLLTAYALGRKEVDASIIREVAEDLNLRGAAQPVVMLSKGSLDSEEDHLSLGTNGKDGYDSSRVPYAHKTFFGRIRSVLGSPLSRRQKLEQ